MIRKSPRPLRLGENLTLARYFLAEAQRTRGKLRWGGLLMCRDAWCEQCSFELR